MPPLKDVLKGLKNPYQRRTRPLWAGPTTDPATDPQGGVTQGMLSRYLGCRERFRVQAIEGVGTHEGFNSRLEFGNLWHAMEEGFCSDVASREGGAIDIAFAGAAAHARVLSRQYPMDRGEVDHWHRMAKALFAEYVSHWAQHPDVVGRTPLLQEQVFAVPYTLPSGRVAWLRGKWDSVDLVPCEDDPACLRVWLQENKTKSSIHVGQLTRRLKCDLQSLFYMVALSAWRELDGYGNPVWFPQAVEAPLAGVRYNVVRRPAHKTVESALKKLNDDRKANRVGEWFCRFNVEVSEADLLRFRRTCLDPLLENLLDDYEWWVWCMQTNQRPDIVWDYGERGGYWPQHRLRHFRTPYHYDPIGEGGSGDVDDYLDTGNMAGLRKLTTLFPELEGPAA